jgi:hypothetical protein
MTVPNPGPSGLDFANALEKVQRFGSGPGLTERIGGLEGSLVGMSRERAETFLTGDGVTADVLEAALTIKDLSAQIDTMIHALGILAALPYILEPGEVVQSLSLGAGNTGRAHDLVTDLQIAEFKFIRWRGGAESIRQNGVFVDIFNLVSTPTDKRKVMYVLDKSHPLRFLSNRRSIKSVLSKSSSVQARFVEAHADRFTHVADYWASVQDQVEIIDLRGVVPALAP